MRIKSYFANSVTEAMAQARAELGSDAMIIASNRTSAESRRLGMYEVVFGVEEVAAPAPAEPAAPPAIPEGLARLRDRMEELRKSVTKKREQASASRIAPGASKAASMLVKAGFPDYIADELARTLPIRSTGETPGEALTEAIGQQIRTSAKFATDAYGRSVVALVGPPGAGKTLTAVKLAVTYGLAKGRTTRLIAVDSQRVGGTDVLARYARCMDVRLDLPANLEALEGVLASQQRNELVIIDTPGYSRSNIASGLPLAGILSKRADVEIHLVLPAYASPADLAAITARFKPFLASKLLFTGMDTCESAAPAAALAATVDMPLSFFGVGDVAPEDLEEASAGSLAPRLLSILMEAAAAAA